MKILITGAAGNLGSMLAEHMMDNGYVLHLMIHNKQIPFTVRYPKKVTIFQADLNKPETLEAPCAGIDVIVHFAGVLFKPAPEKFLPITNLEYFKNLVDVAVARKVKKIILISFPHVEGESFPGEPVKGTRGGNPNSVHAGTRLQEEEYLFEVAKRKKITPVVLRPGMIYGKHILMLEAARWLAKHWLLGIWRKPTWIHLLSIDDFLLSVEASVRKKTTGIYNLGDEGTITLQQFLDLATAQWGHKRPWRMPIWLIYLAAWLTEKFASLFKTTSPLTRDFIKIGMQSYYGDTTRMRKELLPQLRYPTIKEGINLL